MEGIPQALRSHSSPRVLRLHGGKCGFRELRWKDRRCGTGQLSAQSKAVGLESRDSRCPSTENSDYQCVFLSSHRNCSPTPSFSTTRSTTSRSETPEACVSRCLKVRGHTHKHETHSTPCRVPYKEQHFMLQTNE